MCNLQGQDCCYRSAGSSDSAFCGQCGDPLLKCGNFATCKGLLNTENYCPACFAPELKLLSDQTKVSVGQAAHLKLDLVNRSTSVRFLMVKQAWIRIANGEWSKIELSWDRVETGQAKPIRFTTSQLESGGNLGAEIVLMLGTQHGFREEVVVFSANFTIAVEDRQDVVVQQNIHYSADAPQTGATIYAPVRVQADQRNEPSNTTRSQQLNLHRAPRYETQFGVRPATRPHVNPATVVEFHDAISGFRGPVEQFGQRCSKLVFGRSRSKEQGGSNDVRLLYSQADGTVDESASLQISREHFCMYAEQGVLKLRALSNRGIRLDRKLILPGDVQIIGDGSKIELAAENSRIVLQVIYQSTANNVDRVLIQRLRR